MNRKASVTMKDGSRVRITIWPFRAPSTAATTKVAAIASEQGPAAERDEGAEDEAGEGHHGADGEIELAADHQQRRRDGEDAELRGRREDVHDAREREHGRIGGGEEEDRDQDETGQRAEFGTPHDLGEKGDLPQALVLNLLDGWSAGARLAVG